MSLLCHYRHVVRYFFYLPFLCILLFSSLITRFIQPTVATLMPVIQA